LKTDVTASQLLHLFEKLVDATEQSSKRNSDTMRDVGEQSDAILREINERLENRAKETNARSTTAMWTSVTNIVVLICTLIAMVWVGHTTALKQPVEVKIISPLLINSGSTDDNINYQNSCDNDINYCYPCE